MESAYAKWHFKAALKPTEAAFSYEPNERLLYNWEIGQKQKLKFDDWLQKGKKQDLYLSFPQLKWCHRRIIAPFSE